MKLHLICEAVLWRHASIQRYGVTFMFNHFRGPEDAEEFIKAIQSTEILSTLKQEGDKFQQYLCAIIGNIIH